MKDVLYPLRFRPLFKTALWGGSALRPLFGAAPSPEPTGEAWVLSDQGADGSVVADGPLAGTTLRDLMRARPRDLLGEAEAPGGRFPLLLKFLDARLPLSVQVHPDDELARVLEPGEARGKTEAWVILRADPGSRLFAGLRPGVGAEAFQAALTGGTLPDVLHSYAPRPGDCVFLEAGTVHAIGAGLLLFEVQQTSDVTYRLHDWGRVDAKTGKPRDLHVAQALQCTNYERGPCDAVEPRSAEDGCEALVSCRYFTLARRRPRDRCRLRANGRCRILVGVEGKARLVHDGADFPLKFGDVYLLPAAVGGCEVVPDGPLTLLECGPV
jgi:mannose-6-phosphate isomerase